MSNYLTCLYLFS